MDRKQASKNIEELFMRMVNKYNALEKIPARHGTKHNLYHSERHLLDKVGDNTGMNVTEFAAAAGVTKGAISQLVTKLEKKGVVKRYKKSTNDKEVFLELTKTGKEVYRRHKEINENALVPLVEELSKHSDEKVEFLVYMFHWLDDYLELSKKRMQEHHQ
ncbi:MAG: MarR family transcriptional regulator [Nitrospiraceae bacterium]|nr:MAG: MarR family transcriptional regulator [Nitrospiraceae bacterium]